MYWELSSSAGPSSYTVAIEAAAAPVVVLPSTVVTPTAALPPFETLIICVFVRLILNSHRFPIRNTGNYSVTLLNFISHSLDVSFSLRYLRLFGFTHVYNAPRSKRLSGNEKRFICWWTFKLIRLLIIIRIIWASVCLLLIAFMRKFQLLKAFECQFNPIQWK